MLRRAVANRMGRAVTAVVETLEGRALMSALRSMLPFSFSIPRYPHTGAGPSHIEPLTLRILEPACSRSRPAGPALSPTPTQPRNGVSLPGDFAVTNLASLPINIGPGQSANIDVQYTASQVGVMFESAILQVQTSDSTLSIQCMG